MKKIRALPIFICTLFLSACALQPGEETPTPASLEPTIQAQQATIDAQQTIIGELEEQLTASAAAPTVAPTLPPAAAPSPTAIPSPSPTAIISTYSGSFQDDFSADLGRYSLGEQIVFQEGGLWMGPFDQCTQFNNEHPAGCIAACLECGLELSEYEIAVDITFSDGAANRYIGVVLRFVDENGNHQVDREDYLLGWVFSVYHADWYVYEHAPGQFPVWRQIATGVANLAMTPFEPNRVRVVAHDGGQRIAIHMNEIRMTRLTSDKPQSGEYRLPDLPAAGSIGFWVAGDGIQIIYDNFTFLDTPAAP